MRRFGAPLLFVLVALLAAPPAAAAQDSAPAQTQPASRTEIDPQRIAELIALIEGPNSAQARQTGVRELLRLNWSETPRRLAAILSGSNSPARIAVATVLAEQADYWDSAYVEPTISMLAARDPAVTAAARRAIAAFPEPSSIEALRSYVLDRGAPLPGRIEAVAALGEMTARDAVGALLHAAQLPEPEVARAAFAALRAGTGMEFENAAAAQRWWGEVEQFTSEEWLERQLRRVADRARGLRANLSAAEARLAKALRDAYVRTPEADRPALLQSYLGDGLPCVRVVGLDLVQAGIAEGKTPAPDAIAAVRAILADTDPAAREGAVRTITALRETADAERLLTLLATEKHAAVRQALAAGLGYLGSVTAVEPLIRVASDENDPARAEAVAALGRLGERGFFENGSGEQVAALLLSVCEDSATTDPALRERAVWAMSRIPDPRFTPALIAALGPKEPAVIRQAAARGLGVIGDAAAIDALVAATSDSDVVVRRTVVDTLAQKGTNSNHLQALWARLATAAEPEEAIREIAWRGALSLLAQRPAAEIDAWIARLPDNGTTRSRRTLELLQLQEKAIAADATRREELGLMRQRIGAAHERLGQPAEAIEAYSRAVQDLSAARSGRLSAAAVDLLRTALVNDKYGDTVAAAVQQAQVDAAEAWRALQEHISGLAARDAAGAELGLVMLNSLLASPPASFADIREQIGQARRQVREQRDKYDTARVDSALAILRTNPDDAEARSVIEKLGRRAAPALQAALRSMASGESDGRLERLVCDLLKAARPDWVGYTLGATDRDGKLQAIDKLPAEEF